MVQKVNPHGLRVEIVGEWHPKWYDEEHKNRDLVKKFNSYNKLLKKGQNFDPSAIRQFERKVKKKISKRLLLPRNRLA